jgi:phosphoglycerol transferase MdoB-like AlkP superfamily enzyme
MGFSKNLVVSLALFNGLSRADDVAATMVSISGESELVSTTDTEQVTSSSSVHPLVVDKGSEEKEEMKEEMKETHKSGHQPNIIFVMLDDVGFADLSYNNKDKMIPTPNIDKLAHKGIIFDWHYSHPTCTPSRASLMTGKYSCDVGLPFAMLAKSPAGLPLHVRTMPQLLREQGYSAHMIG